MSTKILLIGSNPSCASTDNSPFLASTRSRSILDGWFKDLDVDVHFVNVSSQKKEGNKPLTTQEIKDSLPDLKMYLEVYKDCKLVALGKTATKALTLLRSDFYEMPHPSGRNRLLNNPNYIKEKIASLKLFIGI